MFRKSFFLIFQIRLLIILFFNLIHNYSVKYNLNFKFSADNLSSFEKKNEYICRIYKEITMEQNCLGIVTQFQGGCYISLAYVYIFFLTPLYLATLINFILFFSGPLP